MLGNMLGPWLEFRYKFANKLGLGLAKGLGNRLVLGTGYGHRKFWDTILDSTKLSVGIFVAEFRELEQFTLPYFKTLYHQLYNGIKLMRSSLKDQSAWILFVITSTIP